MACRGTRLALGLLAAVASSGCLVLPTWVPAVRGRVVERESGAPVAGVLVHAWYPATHALSHGAGRWPGGSAITNSDGEFFIAGRAKAELIVPFLERGFLPHLIVCDPVYGMIGVADEWTHGSTVRVAPTPGVAARTRERDVGCSEFRAETRRFAPKPDEAGR